MKVLVIDRDRMNSQMIQSRLEACGHGVRIEASKNSAMEVLGTEDFDMVLLDPAPQTTARPIVLGIRRTLKKYAYIVLMSHSLSQKEAIHAGTNDILSKPLDIGSLEQKTANARRLIDMVRHIGNAETDFPSAGGVISKSAFNQLFLSCMDRADRYGELSYVLFINLENHNEIRENDNPYAADFASAKMAQHLVKMRRQSDILAQTDAHQYALLLQRPLYETEPVEAAARFADTLSQQTDIFSAGTTPPEICVSLVELPVGSQVVEHRFSLGEDTAASPSKDVI